MRTLSLLLSFWLLTVVAMAQIADVGDSVVVNPPHVASLFGEVGKTTRFQGKVGKLAADFKLVMQADENIVGSYTYAGRKQVYTLKGVMNDIGDITLTEYTSGKPTATCELVPKGDCYTGQMRNTDGRSFPMTMCLQVPSKASELESLATIKEEPTPKEESASNVELAPKEEFASNVESDLISDNEPSFTEKYGLLLIGLLLILVLPIIAFFVIWNFVKRSNPQGASSFLESVRRFNGVNTSGLIKGLVVAGGLVLVFNKCSNSAPAYNETESSAYKYVNKKHHCTWCKKEYDGGGYMHIMDGCEPATGTFAQIDVQCSEKCCYESWNAGRR